MTFCKVIFLTKKVTKPRPKVRFVTHFLTYMSDLLYMFILLSNMTNFSFSFGHIYTPGGFPWLHVGKWAFLCYMYQHNFELSTVNLDYLGPLENTGQAVLILYAVKGLNKMYIWYFYSKMCSLACLPLSVTIWKKPLGYHAYRKDG